MRAVVALLRPQQWIKNFFLFAPLIFSKHLFDEELLRTSSLGFFVFCLLSSCVYVLNDIADREADRLHPIKKLRPLAAGTLSVPVALSAAVLLLASASLAAVPLNPKFIGTAAIYFLLNIGYSYWLKQVFLVDVFVIAAGFMLRVLAGAFVIDVLVSPWLVLCTLFVSLFLATSKRRGESILLQQSPGVEGRHVLSDYDLTLIDQMMTVAAAGMAISYALYTVAERTVHIFGTENLIFTTVFVLFGIFRYLFLIRRRQSEDNPTYLLLTDGILILNVFAWFVSCVVIIYFNEIKAWW